MKKTKIVCMIAFLCLLFLGIKENTYAATNTYKVVYHYSLQNKTQKVVKTYNVGSRATMLDASKLGFTSSTKVFLGWNGYRQKLKQWVLFNQDPKVVKFGAYQSKLYLLLAGKQIVYSPTAGDEFHLYGYWMDANKIDASHYYFSGKINSESQAYCQIQNALNLAKKVNRKITVYVPKGTYYITNTLLIFSDTKLQLDPAASIIRSANFKSTGDEYGPPMLFSKAKDSTKGGGYTQGCNITVEGGIWQGNRNTKTCNNGSVIRFNHGQNIVIKNLTVKNFSCKHAVVLAGIKDAIISNVQFKDFNHIPGSYVDSSIERIQSHAEALHIDMCNSLDANIDSRDGKGEPDAYPLDNTICENITIKDCIFARVLTGLGNHVPVKSNYWTNKFVVKNCTFKDIEYYCMDMYNKKNVTLSGNKVSGINLKAYMYCVNINESGLINDHPELPILP